MVNTAEQLVGRPDGARRIRPDCSQISSRASRARSSSSASPASARPAYSPSSPIAPTARGHLVLTGSASELERDLPFWVFVDALDEYAEGLDPRRLEHLDGQTRGGARARLPEPGPARRRRWRRRAPGRAIPHPPRRARAAGAARGDEAARPDPRRSALGRLRLDRADRRAPSPPAVGARAARDGLAATADAGPAVGGARACPPSGTAHPSRALGVLRWRRRTSSSGGGVDMTAALYEETGGNPFYLEQLARSLELARLRRSPRRRPLARWRRGAAARWPPRWPRSSRCCPGRHAGCWKERRLPATRSSPSWSRPRRG